MRGTQAMHTLAIIHLKRGAAEVDPKWIPEVHFGTVLDRLRFDTLQSSSIYFSNIYLARTAGPHQTEEELVAAACPRGRTYYG